MGHEVAIIQPQVPAFSMNDIEKVATAIARGGLFGSKDPYAVLTLCMLAHAEGQHPAVVFRDYDLIQGKPAKKAEAMLRDFIGGGGKVTWNQLDDECADATFSHPQGGTVTINWTMARANKAQLGSKDMWKKYPRQMLRSRVVSEGVRTVYPNATSGLYVPEEVRDFGSDALPSDTPATPEPKRARDLKPGAKQIEALNAAPQSSSTAVIDRQLAELKALAKPGNMDALGAAWKEIGPEARKALAAELPALKAACESADDVPFDGGSATPSPPEAKAAELKAALASASDSPAVEALVDEYAKHKEAFDEDQRNALEIAISKARGRFAAEVEG